jgi:hypothetical protein
MSRKAAFLVGEHRDEVAHIFRTLIMIPVIGNLSTGSGLLHKLGRGF